MIDGTGPLLPHIQEGKIRALAVTGKTRSPDFPNLPTMIESGYPDYVLNVLDRNRRAGRHAGGHRRQAQRRHQRQPAIRRGEGQASPSSTSSRTSPPRRSSPAFLAAEAEKWGGIIRDAGIKAE